MLNASAKADSVLRLQRLKRAFEFHSDALYFTREYFRKNGFCEVFTPAAIDAPAIEEYIEAPRVPAASTFLRSSPELALKCLLSAGMTRIYELGPCFRLGEHGRIHRQEFTMLEWYMAGCDYMELLQFMRGLFNETAAALKVPVSIYDPAKEWQIIPVREAFRRFAGEDADQCAAVESRFEEVLVEKVEPALPKDVPCVLIDYPIRFGAFARAKKSDPTLAERWEVYFRGVELANAYGELVDPEEQLRRFRVYAEKRKLAGLTEYPEPVEFMEAIRSGIPDSAGCALGFDRFVMTLAGKESLDEVVYPHR